MIVVVDYIDFKGRIVHHAGDRLPDGVSLDPYGLASDEREAEKKLRSIAKSRLAECCDAKTQQEHDRLMFDYHRSMSLAFAFRYSRLVGQEA